MSGTNEKNILLEVIFYAGFVVMSYSSKVGERKKDDRAGERERERMK